MNYFYNSCSPSSSTFHSHACVSVYTCVGGVKMLTLVEMKSVTQDQILDVVVFISLHADTIGKGLNPSVLSSYE